MSKLEYFVVVPSEIGAGIRGFTDEVTIDFKDWQPDFVDLVQEATEHFRQAIAEWYDGGKVCTKEEYELQIALEEPSPPVGTPKLEEKS